MIAGARIVLLALGVAACGGEPAPPRRAADTPRTHATVRRRGPKPAPSPALSREPFAIVQLATDDTSTVADALGPLPPLELPRDAHVDNGVEKPASGQGSPRHVLRVRLPGTYERFEHEVGDWLIDVLNPPTGVAVVFAHQFKFGIGSYVGLVVVTPPLAKTSDLASVEVAESQQVNADLVAPKTHRKFTAVKLTFTPEARRRLSEWGARTPGNEVAYLINGRAIRVSSVGGSMAWLRLVLEWPDRDEAIEAVEKLVAAVPAHGANAAPEDADAGSGGEER